MRDGYHAICDESEACESGVSDRNRSSQAGERRLHLCEKATPLARLYRRQGRCEAGRRGRVGATREDSDRGAQASDGREIASESCEDANCGAEIASGVRGAAMLRALISSVLGTAAILFDGRLRRT